jgi:hypothetical protein
VTARIRRGRLPDTAEASGNIDRLIASQWPGEQIVDIIRVWPEPHSCPSRQNYEALTTDHKSKPGFPRLEQVHVTLDTLPKGWNNHPKPMHEIRQFAYEHAKAHINAQVYGIYDVHSHSKWLSYFAIVDESD